MCDERRSEFEAYPPEKLAKTAVRALTIIVDFAQRLNVLVFTFVGRIEGITRTLTAVILALSTDELTTGQDDRARCVRLLTTLVFLIRDADG